MTIYTCPRCRSDLMPVVYTTLPPISAYICTKCGWQYEEKQETIERIPFPNKEQHL